MVLVVRFDLTDPSSAGSGSVPASTWRGVVHYIRDLGYIVYYSSLTGTFTVWCGLRYACFGFDDDLLVNYSCSADSFGFCICCFDFSDPGVWVSIGGILFRLF